MPTRREPQTWEYLKGDLAPRRSLLTDLRNDNAGDAMMQAQNAVLRYLETLPAQDTVNVETLAEDLGRHWPFHGQPESFFRKAVDALKKAGWIKEVKGELELDKITRVARRYLSSSVHKAR